MCELLHTGSANQACDSTILSLGTGPGRAECAETVDNWVPGAQIGGPLSGGTRLRSQGRVVRRPASIQNISGLPQGPAQPFRATLIVRRSVRLFTTEGDRP